MANLTLKLLVSMAGPGISFTPGDSYQAVSEAEAKRLIDAGMAAWPEPAAVVESAAIVEPAVVKPQSCKEGVKRAAT